MFLKVKTLRLNKKKHREPLTKNKNNRNLTNTKAETQDVAQIYNPERP